MTKAKIHEYLTTLLLIACIIVATAVRGRGISTVSAESDTVQNRYEQTNVMTDLRESTLGGKAFDITDYPHNELGKPQVISFVEFCYSYYADKQSDYGLYAYVYNPQDRAIDAGTARNKIQLTYGDKPSYAKYTLKQLSYSKDAGIEGRFYKYKVIFTASARGYTENGQARCACLQYKRYRIVGQERSHRIRNGADIQVQRLCNRLR